MYVFKMDILIEHHTLMYLELNYITPKEWILKIEHFGPKYYFDCTCDGRNVFGSYNNFMKLYKYYKKNPKYF